MNFTKDQTSEITIKYYDDNQLKIGNHSIDYSCIVGMNQIIGKWNNKNAENGGNAGHATNMQNGLNMLEKAEHAEMW